MLKITKLADYATVIMHYLSTRPDVHLSATAIAAAVKLTTTTVSKVLKQLSEAGLVIATRGAQGGYHLTRSPDSISLAEIIIAIDGKPALTECSEGEHQCQYHEHCGVRGNWQRINTIIYDVLNRLSLQEMQAPIETLKPVKMLGEVSVLKRND